MDDFYKNIEEFNPGEERKTLIVFYDMIADVLSNEKRNPTVIELLLQYDINREAAKILALSSGKIDKYEYVAGEKILPSDQSRMIEQAKFTYSPLGNALENQARLLEDKDERK